jgi:hypothetical protein
VAKQPPAHVTKIERRPQQQPAAAQAAAPQQTPPPRRSYADARTAIFVAGESDAKPFAQARKGDTVDVSWKEKKKGALMKRWRGTVSEARADGRIRVAYTEQRMACSWRQMRATHLLEPNDMYEYGQIIVSVPDDTGSHGGALAAAATPGAASAAAPAATQVPNAPGNAPAPAVPHRKCGTGRPCGSPTGGGWQCKRLIGINCASGHCRLHCAHPQCAMHALAAPPAAAAPPPLAAAAVPQPRAPSPVPESAAAAAPTDTVPAVAAAPSYRGTHNPYAPVLQNRLNAAAPAFVPAQALPQGTDGEVAGDEDETQDEDLVADDDSDDEVDEAAPDTYLELPAAPAPFLHRDTFAPAVAGLKGAYLRTSGVLVITVRGDENAPHLSALAQKGFVKRTRQLHRNLLRKILAMPADLAELNFATAVIVQLSREANKRRWKRSTMLKYMASTASALRNLAMYTNSTESLLLNASAEWRQAMRAISKEAKEELPRVPVAMTQQQAERIITNEAARGDHEVALLVGISWSTAARSGCVMQLETENVHNFAADAAIETGAPPTEATIEFRRGKGVLFRGPYAVPTVLHPLTARLLAERLQIAPAQSRLVGVEAKKRLLAALRREDPRLEAKSIRRGAAQALSVAGVPEATIMLFTGHTRVATLRRYLNYGVIKGERTTQGVAAARAGLVQRIAP